MDPINQQPPMQAPAPTETKKVGPIITVLVIVLVLVIGAIYLFASGMNDDQVADDATAALSTEAEVTPVTNESDDMESIETDLEASIEGVDGQNF